MTGIRKRIDDANFLWSNGRKESAFLLILIAFASLSRLRYPKYQYRDNEAFMKLFRDFNKISVRVEYRGKLEPIENIFYKWIRCQLIHEGGLPMDLEFIDGGTSIRAGGAPEFVLKLGTGWFVSIMNSILNSSEVK